MLFTLHEASTNIPTVGDKIFIAEKAIISAMEQEKVFKKKDTGEVLASYKYVVLFLTDGKHYLVMDPDRTVLAQIEAATCFSYPTAGA